MNATVATQHLLLDFRRNRVVVLEIHVADLGRNGKAGRHRQLGPAHLGQPCAFAAEGFLHLSIAVRGSIAKREDFLHHVLLLCIRNDFRKIRDARKLVQQPLQ